MLPIPFPASTISLAYGAIDGEYYTFASPHQGTDFSSRSQGVTEGTVIRASGPGRVVRQGVGPVGVSPSIDRPNSLAGNSIDVDYGDFIARYMHRTYTSPSPATGAETVEGTELGEIGSTGLSGGPHLHLETWDKRTGRRVDPENYFDFSRTVGEGSPAGGNARPFTPAASEEDDDMYAIRQAGIPDSGIIIRPGVPPYPLAAQVFEAEASTYGLTVRELPDWRYATAVREQWTAYNVAEKYRAERELAQGDVQRVAEAVRAALLKP